MVSPPQDVSPEPADNGAATSGQAEPLVLTPEGAGPPEDAPQKRKRRGKPLREAISDLVRKRPIFRTLASVLGVVAILVLCLFVVPLSCFVGWLIWFKWLPQFWNWSFAELSLRNIVGVFAVPILAVAPPYLPILCLFLAAKLAAILAEEETKSHRQYSTQAVSQLIASKPYLRTAALLVCLVCIPLSLFGVWWMWRFVPKLWPWAFSALSIRSVVGVSAILAAVVVSLCVPILCVIGAAKLFVLYAEAETNRATEAVRRGSSEQERVEEELRPTDKSGLVLLLRYSRIQLEAYYAVGLTQTQRSFLYSVIAMWIGFVVILAGIILRVIDLEHFGIKAPDRDVSTLAVLSGVIIELISALFLWIYRNSVRQLTYFYDRQMFNHSVLMCQRVAETMTDSDGVKKLIAEKTLDKAWALDQQSLPQADRLLALASKK